MFDERPTRALLQAARGALSMPANLVNPSAPSLSDEARAGLRRSIKLQRRQLSAMERSARSRAIATALRRTQWLRPGQRVGLYWATAGEVDVAALATLASDMHCELYLPRITSWRARRMQFVRWDHGQALRQHRFGMYEPVAGQAIAARNLDLVFVPAVAVDLRGTRLGSGAGFYDRHFAFRRTSQWRRPRLIAVVYAFQVVDALPARAWDVAADAILTESGLQRIHR